jgi:hypothetical protein
MGARFFPGGVVSHFRGEGGGGVKLVDPIFNGHFFSKKKIQKKNFKKYKLVFF